MIETLFKKQEVVLVDEFDRETGLMEKYEAHEKGLLHRAISVCLFDSDGNWLLQKRAPLKYHSPGLIANSCCSHPFHDEIPLLAAHRRLKEELNLSLDPKRLIPLGSFIYKEEVGQGLIEHEFDYLFIANVKREEVPEPNPEEVAEVLWMREDEIQSSLEKDITLWARWFYHVFYEVRKRQ